MLTIEHMKVVTEMMREISHRPAFNGVGAIIILFNHEGDMAVSCPDGLPTGEILRDALRRVEQRSPDQTAKVGASEPEKN